MDSSLSTKKFDNIGWGAQAQSAQYICSIQNDNQPKIRIMKSLKDQISTLNNKKINLLNGLIILALISLTSNYW